MPTEGIAERLERQAVQMSDSLRELLRAAASALREAQAQRDELVKELHAALHEPEYAGTRQDWINRCHAAESRAERAEGALRWQPIETAPKDGTTVLGYTPGAFCAVGDMYFDVEQEEWRRLPDQHVQPRFWRLLPDDAALRPSEGGKGGGDRESR